MIGDGPFVLFDDARAEGGKARLFARPKAVIDARRADEVRPALARLREAVAQGAHAAGFLAYEAGHALEERLAPLARDAGEGEPPLLWFGLFDEARTLPRDALVDILPDGAGAWAGLPRPLVDRAAYEAMIASTLDLIAAGDIYQANITFPSRLPVAGSPLALYARLVAASRAGWGGVLFTGAHWLLSFSPELFFTLEQGALTARPMKGTALRRRDFAEDAAAARSLAADPKQQAENLMIIDLLRNDLARVAAPGSVTVPELFTVETYPTLHQMTSTVAARLTPGLNAIDVIEAIFPCGSITGAPKIRAMEVIAALEHGSRGPYTGSIGWIDPGGDAAFNVAIRTLTIAAGEGHALMGLGSGIVADSQADAERCESLAKGAFTALGGRPFDLIETMRFDAQEGLVDLERHLERMKTSADALGFAFDRHDARNELQAATFRLRDSSRVRMLLSKTGAVAIEVRPLPEAPEGPVAVSLAPLPVSSDDFRLAHKTSDRAFYDGARRAAGSFEVLFVDRAGFVTEGSFTNVFVERDGTLVTPPLSRGLLPGVLRRRLIDEGKAIEGDIRPADLANGFLIGNALRGLIPAVLVAGSGMPGL